MFDIDASLKLVTHKGIIMFAFIVLLDVALAAPWLMLVDSPLLGPEAFGLFELLTLLLVVLLFELPPLGLFTGTLIPLLVFELLAVFEFVLPFVF